MRLLSELHEIASHPSYEVDMLFATGTAIIGQLDPLRQNAMLESFTIHARNLRHFLDPEGRIDPDDDVLAADFFDTAADWLAVRGPMPPSPDKLRFRVGREIAHLPYHAGDPGNPYFESDGEQ
jgi:hypothetical protein